MFTQKPRNLVIPFVSLALIAALALHTNSRIFQGVSHPPSPLANLSHTVRHDRDISSSPTPLPTNTNLHVLRRNSFLVRGGNGDRRVVIVTAATHHYLDFIHNLRCSVRAATGHEVILFALDRNISTIARKLGLATIDAFYKHQDVKSDKPFSFGTNGFNVISKLKLYAFRDALLAGMDLLFTDVDVVWCDNAPARLVAQLDADNFADVLIQNGRPSDSFWPADANTGFFYAKANDNVVAMFSYLARLVGDPSSRSEFDQSLFKNHICPVNRTGPGVALRNREIGRATHVCKWEDRVTVEMLPLKKYPNGHSPLNKELKQLTGGELRKACVEKKIVVFHNNWCSGSEKNRRMDAQGLWAVDKTTKKCRGLVK